MPTDPENSKLSIAPGTACLALTILKKSELFMFIAFLPYKEDVLILSFVVCCCSFFVIASSKFPRFTLEYKSFSLGTFKIVFIDSEISIDSEIVAVVEVLLFNLFAYFFAASTPFNLFSEMDGIRLNKRAASSFSR